VKVIKCIKKGERFMEDQKTIKYLQVLTLKLGDDEYGIDISKITTIIENNYSVTRVPGAPEYIQGVINLRGDIVPVMELRKKLKLAHAEDTEETKIIVVNVEDMMVGIKVDKVLEVIQLDRKSIDEISSADDEEVKGYFMGLGKYNDRVIILINAEKLVKE